MAQCASRSHSSWRARTAAALFILVSVAGASCGDASKGVTRVTKTSATFAEQTGAIPNYIFPLASSEFYSAANIFQFQYLMYRPLYSFGTNGQVQLNDALSLADPPVYSDDGKSVTITLKGWKWSDGVAITARDVQFWQNLLTANKEYWPAYVPGEYPDNVLSSTLSPQNPLQITFNLSQAYGSYFFTYNELSQITPLPQHTWDKESATGPVGNYDETPAGARAVYTFLDSQSRSVGTYDTNPLWRVVSGPWKLKSMDATGNVQMVPNPGYGGPVKATLKVFRELPFTQENVELNQLKAATSASNTSVDFGYLPADEARQKASLSGLYNLVPWSTWSINYIPVNFTNATSGPIFSQLYFRQAMQYLVDQRHLIDTTFLGYANPTYGPVPIADSSQFVDTLEKKNPYAYSPTSARSLLRAHGWTVNPDGVSICLSPGTGSGECGAGIKQGQPASFSLEYAGGAPTVTEEMNQLASDFAQAGIQIKLSETTFDAVLGTAAPCTPGTACSWDLAYWDSPWIYSPDYYPSGDQLWACTGSASSALYAGSNVGGYCDPQAEADIAATETSGFLQAMSVYENYVARDLPVIWIPVEDYTLAEVNKALKGTSPLDPLLDIYPEAWRWS
jgi:peptide/nickel transport system substrate-binding protein